MFSTSVKTPNDSLLDGTSIAPAASDETEIGEATTVVLIDGKRPKEWVEKRCHEDVARWLGLETDAPGFVSWDVFDSVQAPGEIILLTSWRDHDAAEAFARAPKLPEEARLRSVRIIRDYGMYDRREAPQYYADVERPAAAR